MFWPDNSRVRPSVSDADVSHNEENDFQDGQRDCEGRSGTLVPVWSSRMDWQALYARGEGAGRKVSVRHGYVAQLRRKV